jgi:K+-sensing histidine kinase KdpD
MRARRQRRHAPPFARMLLGVGSRERDVALIERMARLALRLPVELLVVHVNTSGAEADPAIVKRLHNATRAARAQWLLINEADAAAALVATAKELDTIVVEAPRRNHRMFTPPSFATRLLKAGARELIALAPR